MIPESSYMDELEHSSNNPVPDEVAWRVTIDIDVMAGSALEAAMIAWSDMQLLYVEHGVYVYAESQETGDGEQIHIQAH